MDTIYAPKEYYERVRTFLKEYKPPRIKDKFPNIQLHHLEGFIKSIWFLGIREKKGRKYYWKLVLSTLFKHPRAFPLSISLSVFGFHFRKVSEQMRDNRIKSGQPS